MTFIPSHCLQLLLLFFFKVSSIRILNLLLYVLVNTSAMHFLCLSFAVGLFGIKRTQNMICYAFIERYSIVTSYSLINLMETVEMWEVFFFLRSSLALPNACLRSPMRRKKITPVLRHLELFVASGGGGKI